MHVCKCSYEKFTKYHEYSNEHELLRLTLASLSQLEFLLSC